MTQPTNTNPSSSDASELDFDYLQKLLRRQAERPPLYENVAIIGCGYVGSTLAGFWQRKGHFVTGTTTRASRVPELEGVTSRVAVVSGNDLDGMRALVREQDTVVVSVAPTGLGALAPNAYANTYVKTANTLAEALRQSTRVKQLVYLSSCSVYGDRRGNWVDETTPLLPSDDRSLILQEAEHILLAANEGRSKTCIFRLGGIYGPGRDLVSMFAGVSGRTLPGKGDRFTCWTHLDDIVGAIEFARSNQLEGIYNLVDDSKLTIRQLTDLVCTSYRLPSARWDSSQMSTSRRCSLRISNQKLKEAGYKLIRSEISV